MTRSIRSTVSSVALILVATASVSAQSAVAPGAVDSSSSVPAATATSTLPATTTADASPSAPIVARDEGRPDVVPQPVPRPVLVRTRRDAPPALLEARQAPTTERVANAERSTRSFPIVLGVGF